jgi:hypothetical protein
MMAVDEPMARVPDSELDFDEELIYRHNGILFTGIGYDEMPGKGLSEVSYRDGMQDGVARDWYPSGKVKGESHFRENSLHGLKREFDDSGNLISESVYEYDILVNFVKRDASGQVIDSFHIDVDSSNYARLERLRCDKGWPCGA